jgi:hypothetical protein
MQRDKGGLRRNATLWKTSYCSKKKKGVPPQKSWPKVELFAGILGGGGPPAGQSSASVESGGMQHACRQAMRPKLLVYAALRY